MQLTTDTFYHLYNRSNRGITAFYNDDNYNYFLEKIRKSWLEYFDILCYCLMPTHFHFIIKTNEFLQTPAANYAVGKLLSSYTRAINNERKTHGSLFQQKSKFKNLINSDKMFDHRYDSSDYFVPCMNYIHFNPVADRLVEKPMDWQFSSYQNFATMKPDPLLNMDLAMKIFGFSSTSEFITLSNSYSEEYRF